MGALNVFLVVLIILFSLIVCLTIHELGHFAFAKAFKMNVKEFSIGFGPKVWHAFTKKNKMRVSLRLIPLGAYVLIDSRGLRDAYVDSPNAPRYGFYLRPKPRGSILFDEAKYWQKMVVMLAGIWFNVAAFLVFWGLWSLINLTQSLALGAYLKDLFANIGYSLVVYNAWAPPGGGAPPIVPDPQAAIGGDFLLRYLISINLATAILNLFPIAPLDGWKIFQHSYERASKRKLPEKLQETLSIIGIVLILWITIGSIANLVV